MSLGIIPIICISTGASIFFVMLILDKYPPKKINKVYGYRTKRSMKSKENWDFAQTYSSVQMKKASLGMFFLGLVGSFVDLGEYIELALGLAIVTGLMFAAIYATEQELKRQFPED